MNLQISNTPCLYACDGGLCVDESENCQEKLLYEEIGKTNKEIYKANENMIQIRKDLNSNFVITYISIFMNVVIILISILIILLKCKKAKWK